MSDTLVQRCRIVADSTTMCITVAYGMYQLRRQGRDDDNSICKKLSSPPSWCKIPRLAVWPCKVQLQAIPYQETCLLDDIICVSGTSTRVLATSSLLAPTPSCGQVMMHKPKTYARFEPRPPPSFFFTAMPKFIDQFSLHPRCIHNRCIYVHVFLKPMSPTR